MVPLLPRPGIAALRSAFETAGYGVDQVNEAIGAHGRSGLARNHTVAADRALAQRDDPLATLIRLFVLQQSVPRDVARAALPLTALTEAGILVSEREGTHATLDVRPYAADDGVDGWVVSDHAATLDTAPATPRPDFVLGVSPASTTLAQLTLRDRVGTALDLGTGCGVQTLHLARHSGRVVATDLNPRALQLAEVTFALSEVDVDLRLGSLYEPVAADTFDLITTNPPFVMSPPAAERLVYREGSHEGDGLMRSVVVDGARRLAPDGTLQVLGNWLHIAGQSWQDRLAAWIEPTGCDAVVLQREVLDPYEYVEIWLADAGLAGTPDYLRRYREWLTYFDRLGVEAVGMGWLTLRNAARPRPFVTMEDWPHAVAQPLGSAIAEQLAGAAVSSLSDDELLRSHWILAADATEETVGPPGAADPAHIVLRRRLGLRRAVELDTALDGVLSVCDGELPLRRIIDAVAHLTETDPDQLTGDVVPRFRDLVATGWLTRTEADEVRLSP